MDSSEAMIAPPLTSDYSLPVRFDEMSPQEQASAVRSCILKFLDEVGQARTGTICAAIGLSPKSESLRRQLRYLCATQQLYSDNVGRDPTYFRNGRLAHPVMQANIEAGTRSYAIRTYKDDMSGRFMTITEYAVTTTGQKMAKSGVRIDLADLEHFHAELSKIVALIIQNGPDSEPRPRRDKQWNTR
jgi:hypothetical protein